jgi:serine/threonine protein kinase
VLKIPDPGLFADPATFNRYQREAEVARRLDHPSVQGAIDAGEKRDEPYLVLRYVPGVSLNEYLRSGLQVPIDTALDWGRQLAVGLAYLHAQGVVHRDLKPGNVLLSPDGRLVIADFGTAQLAGARRLTWKHLSAMLGTPDYMSPEQAQGGRGDARSDIYAWGVMMYQILTGGVPFEGRDWMEVIAAHMQADPNSIHRQRHDVPPAIEAVVLHAMRRHPDNRYPSAGALLDDLDHLDRVDLGTYDLAPEKPMGGLVPGGGPKGLWNRMTRGKGR